MRFVKLSEISDLLNGYAFKSKNYVENGIRIIRIANVQEGYIADEHPCFYPFDSDEDIKKYYLFEGDILVSLTGNVGRVGIITSELLPAALNQRVSCIRLKNNAEVNSKFLFYYLRRKQFVLDCTKASKGVAQLNLSTKWLENYPVPLPNTVVQQRIVARIEELFSQLDSGVETLRKTKQQLAVYRQAVLKEAFGNYRGTEVLAESVVTRGKHSFTIGPFGSDLKVSDYRTVGIPLVFVRDIRNGFTSEAYKYVSQDKGEQLKAHQVNRGDLLITKMGDPPGDCCIYPFDYPSIITADCIKMEIDQTILLPLYAMYYIQSAYGKEQIKAITQGVAQKKVSLARFKKIKFNIPSISEQKSIVEKIGSRLSICDSIEQTVDTALQQAEALRQSILKEAFEGGI